MSGSFVLNCQLAFQADFILSICRITDPAKTFGFENLSLLHLRQGLDSSQHSALPAKLDATLSTIEPRILPFRDWRNKKYAHGDIPTVLRLAPTPLPNLTKDEIDEVLRLLAKFLNDFYYHFDRTTTLYHEVIQQGDGNALIDRLKDAAHYREQYLANVRSNLGA